MPYSMQRTRKRQKGKATYSGDPFIRLPKRFESERTRVYFFGRTPNIRAGRTKRGSFAVISLVQPVRFSIPIGELLLDSFRGYAFKVPSRVKRKRRVNAGVR